MIVDFHTHIFPQAVVRDRERFFETEPDFALLYRDSGSKLADIEDLIDSMDESGIDLSVVCGFPWKSPELFRRHNDCITEAVVKYPKRIKGFGSFDVENALVEKETERCLRNGLSGIGELAFYRSGIDAERRKRLEPVMEICGAGNLPVLIHTNETIGDKYPGKSPVTLKQIYDLALAFPDNKIVLAHWGGGIFFYCLMKRTVKRALANVYYDTAASPYLYDPQVYRTAIDLAGIDKILFSSDYPLLSPNRYFAELRSAGLDPSQIDAICGENAIKILNPA